MSKDLITIITPTFRRDIKIIERCIGSVKLQTIENFKHLIYSDGIYEQNVKKLIDNQNDNRLSYGVTKVKHGGYGEGVRQEVLEKVDTEFVMFLDDDNVLMPTYIKKMTDAILNNDVDFAVCNVIHYGPLPQHLGKPPIVMSNNIVKLQNIDTLQIVIKTDKFMEVGWKKMGYCSDGYTYEELGKRFKFISVNECLAIHF
jgi:glycosyltransferase involved in cell wall biosynthesis